MIVAPARQRSSQASVQAHAKAEALDNFAGDVLGVAESLVEGKVAGELGFMPAAERAKEGAQAGVGTFGGVAMDFAYAVTVVVTCPLVLGVADRDVYRPPLVAGQFVAGARCTWWQQRLEHALTAFLVRAIKHPHAYLTRLPTNDLEDRRPVVRIRPASWSVSAAPLRRVFWVGMGVAFPPPRSDTPHQTRSGNRSFGVGVPFRS